MRTLLELHYDDVHLQHWRAQHGDEEKRALMQAEAEESPASVEDVLREAREMVELHGSTVSFPEGRRELGVFCSRALDMKDITTIGACIHQGVNACVR